MPSLLRYDPLVEVVSANKWREDTDGDGGDELRASLLSEMLKTCHKHVQQIYRETCGLSSIQ